MIYSAMVLPIAMLMTAPSGRQDAARTSHAAPMAQLSCTLTGEHAGTLSQSCVDQMAEWVATREGAFFTIILDDTSNLYVQGFPLGDGAMQFEVPGPRYTELTEAARAKVEAMGFVVDEASGMYTLKVAGSDPRARKPGDHVMAMARALGFDEDAPITYRLFER